MLRIRNWDKHYETNKTRPLKSLSWIALPIALDSDGYAEVMEHENGAAHFGIFVALLEVAARGVPRGCLLRARKVPHDARSLSRMCRIPAPLVQEALDRLVSIGWLETWHEEGTIEADAGRDTVDTLQVLPVLQGGPVRPTGSTGTTLPDPTGKTTPTGHGKEGNGGETHVENVKVAENPPGSSLKAPTGLSLAEKKAAAKKLLGVEP